MIDARMPVLGHGPWRRVAEGVPVVLAARRRSGVDEQD
jgi:hypothetical protein